MNRCGTPPTDDQLVEAAEMWAAAPMLTVRTKTLAASETASPLAAPTATVKVEEMLPKITS
jgi:hypothetical protein